MYTVKAEIVRTENCARQIYDQHCHGDFEILFVLSGSIRLNLEGEQLLLTENTGIVIEPLRYHIVTGNNTRYHRLILTFGLGAVPEMIRPHFLERIRASRRFSAEVACGALQRYAAVTEKREPVFGALLEALLTQAFYSIAFDCSIVPKEAGSKPVEKLKQIIGYVDENLQKEISLSDVSAQVYMSQSALCHLFRQEMNISLKQYILQKKMMYAKALLESGTPPGVAASLCGYKNYASFYKIFQKVTGVTPGRIHSGDGGGNAE